MAASATDRLQQVGLSTATTLSAPGYTTGGTGITVGSTTNWPTATGVTFAIDTVTIVNGVEVQDAGSYNEYVGTVATGTTVTNVSWADGNGDRNYSAGSTTRVYIPVSKTRENRIVTWGLVNHDQVGNHKDLTGSNSKTVLGLTDGASTVNNLRVTAAATTVSPTLTAEGTDSNVDVTISPKGTGVVRVDGSVPRSFFALYDFIESGCVLSGTGYGTTLNWSLTSGVVWIGGKRLTVAATTGTVTASKDTYFDLLDPGSGTVATLVNTGGNIVANNAASPALAASSVRLGIIVSGAGSIAAATSVNQGQETMLLPIASSVPYAVTDSLGNLICPRDPQRKVLGYRQILANQTGIGTSATQVTGLSLPIIVPANRKVHIKVFAWAVDNSGAGNTTTLTIWDGTVGAGTQVGASILKQSAAASGTFQIAEIELTPSATSKTYNIGLHGSAGTTGIYASAGNVSFAKVELA